MNKIKEYLQSHSKGFKVFIFGYIVFAGCFIFPLWSERFPFNFMKGYLVIASYGIIALALAGIWGSKMEKPVYLLTVGLTIIGMLCRYFLEFGEHSNTYNFTLLNIVIYISVIPIFTVIAYHYIVKWLIKNS